MKIRITFLLLLFDTFFSANAQITFVNSISELVNTTNLSNVEVVMTPGTYTITRADVDNGLVGQTLSGEIIGDSGVLFLFEGNNSTYDFTGVTINIETEVLSAFGNINFHELQIIGSNNVLKNLTMVDDGEVDDAPGRSATNIVMDGENNTIDGFNVTVKGSTPYGYGDIFGKGAGPVIGHKKHSACLIRGNSNKLLNSSFTHRAYGHGIFFQAANDPYVKGCYVEGELSTVDAVLAEQGTGSSADNVDFLTVWGFYLTDLTENYSFSLQEDGIRSYNAGETIIDGVEYDRGVTNATVIDCTVIKMRSGVTIGWAGGTKYVENCTALACESGYWVGSNTEVVNCRGDASVGPLFSEDVRRSNSIFDLTLLDNYVPKIGNTPTIYLAGSNHDFTLKDGTTYFNEEMELLVGGRRYGHRWLDGSVEDLPYFAAEAITINNQTEYPLILSDNASNNTVISCGPVTDLGTDNLITQSCEPIPECGESNAFSLIEAENYCLESGILTNDANTYVGWINNGDWLKFENVDFGSGADTFLVSGASSGAGGTIEIRQQSLLGTTIGTVEIGETGDWNTFETFSTEISSISGIHNIYLVFVGEGGYLFNIDNFYFESGASQIISVTDVELSPESVLISVEETIQLTAEVFPIDATDKSISWTSNNESIAIVNSEGLVTGVDEGTAIISVFTEDGGYSALSEITVTASMVDIPVTGVNLSPESVSLVVGEIVQLTAEVFPIDATDKSINWASSNESIAIVNSEGLVTGVDEGDAIISVVTEDGEYSALSEITVTASMVDIPVTGVNLNLEIVSLVVGETSQLTAEVLPIDATDKSINWASSNESIAIVNSQGEVTGVDEGTAIISVVTEDGGYSALSEITVTASMVDIPVTAVNLSPEIVSLVVGETSQLTAEVFPIDATDKSINWASSNESIAIVNSQGEVTGVDEGDAVISVATEDGGFTNQIMVTVIKKSELLEENSTVILYPNPSSSIINIDQAMGAVVQIYDVLGRLLIYNSVLSNELEIDISNFESDLYYVKIIVGSKVYIKQLIKE